MLKTITFLLIGFEKDDTVKTKEDGTQEGNSLWSNSGLGHTVFCSMDHIVPVLSSPAAWVTEFPGAWVTELWSWSLALGHTERSHMAGAGRHSSLSKPEICRQAEREGPGRGQCDRNKWGLQDGCKPWSNFPISLQASLSEVLHTLKHYWALLGRYCQYIVNSSPLIYRFKIAADSTSFTFKPLEMNLHCLLTKSALLQCFSYFNVRVN